MKNTMEGKNLWKKLISGGGNDEPTIPVVETTSEDTERDLNILREYMRNLEGANEESAMDALSRLFQAAESNPQVLAELEIFSNEYKESLQGDELEDPKNEICKKIYEWLEKQRLGEFYYDKNNPRRKLGP